MIVPVVAVDENPNPKDREAIFDPLLKYNDSKVGTPSLAALAVLLRDPENGTVVGGLWALWFTIGCSSNCCLCRKKCGETELARAQGRSCRTEARLHRRLAGYVQFSGTRVL